MHGSWEKFSFMRMRSYSITKHIAFEEICMKIWGDFILMGQSMNSFKFGRLKKTEAKQSNGSMKRKSGF